MAIFTEIEMMRWVLATLALVITLGALSVLAKKLGPHGHMRGKGRLKIVDMIHLDPKTRAFILRQDTVEHVVVMGPNGQLHLNSIEAADAPEDAPILPDNSIGFLKDLKKKMIPND